MKKGIYFLAILSIVAGIFAQPFWTADDFENFSYSYSRYKTNTALRRELYESEYHHSYPFEFRQSADFVAYWQVTDSSSMAFGGIIEAEEGELHDVIQTDNTQESIMIWSFAHDFFSTDEHADYISRSWDYCNAFPGWEEEISDYSWYYPCWNSALGLLATMYNVQYTGDSTYLYYGDSCAIFLSDTSLPFDHSLEYYRLLHPMVTSFAAGCLYQYSVFTDNEAYRTRALGQAERVLDYIAENPDSFLSVEEWAMSSGTTLWGLVKSYFSEHPDELVEWLADNFDYLPEMAPPATEYDPYLWDNSWNIWYANGYRAVYEATGDTVSYNRYRHILDYILAQDYDDDGGMMSSSGHPYTEDMTWVTTYILFMGIEGMLDELPDTDIGVTAIEIEDRPVYVVGDSLEAILKSANFGLLTSDGSTLFNAGDFESRSDLHLDLGERVEILYTVVPDERGILTISAISNAVGDEDTSNDSMTVEIDIRGRETLTGDITSTEGGGIAATLHFTIVLPDTQVYVGYAESGSDGHFETALPEGEYLLDIEPEFPYPNQYSIPLTVAHPPEPFSIEIPKAHVLFVDDDGGGVYDSYVRTALDSLGILYHYLERETSTITADMADQLTYRTILWFCGTDTTETLTEDDRDALSAVVDAGNYAIVTGQYISDEIAGTSFLTETVGAEYVGDLTRNFLRGIPGDPITGDFDYITTTGTGSAGNSADHDKLVPSTGTGIIVSTPGDTFFHAVSNETTSDGKIVYFGFGLESIGRLGAMPDAPTRSDLLRRVFAWFSPEWNVHELTAPQAISLLHASPNPFNSSVSISADSDGVLRIFDIQGRMVYGPTRMDAGAELVWHPSLSTTSGIYRANLIIEVENSIDVNLLYLK